MNFNFWSSDADDETRDARVASWLSELDPGRDDPAYWMGFHRQAVDASRLELLRRRRESERSVAGVVSGWSRTVIPAALMAAAVAGFLLAQPDVTDSSPEVTLDDLITMGAPGPIPADMSDVEDEDAWLVLASEEY